MGWHGVQFQVRYFSQKIDPVLPNDEGIKESGHTRAPQNYLKGQELRAFMLLSS